MKSVVSQLCQPKAGAAVKPLTNPLSARNQHELWTLQLAERSTQLGGSLAWQQSGQRGTSRSSCVAAYYGGVVAAESQWACGHKPLADLVEHLQPVAYAQLPLASPRPAVVSTKIS